jgi:hypothetical protein
LIGIEYLVSNDVYQSMPVEEKAFWHDHEFEVDEGLLRSLTQTGAIQVGKRANRLLLSANPGEDIRNLRRVALRLTDGEWPR